ncbi:hypothetical protein Q7P37_004628 [Cladosporium fusiforme]
MGNTNCVTIVKLTLLMQVTLADYFIQITDAAKQTVFNEKNFPSVDTTKFGSIKSLGLEGAVKISDWSFGLDTPVSLTIGGGTSASKTHFSPITINRVADAYSPILFMYTTKSSPLTLTLAATSGVGRGVVQLSAVYTFSNAILSSLQQSAGDGAAVREVLTVDYGQFSMQYGSFGPDGKISKVNKYGWDAVMNRAVK